MSNTHTIRNIKKGSENIETNSSYTNKKLTDVEGRPYTLVREVETAIFSPYSTHKEKYTCDWRSWKDFYEDPEKFREIQLKQKHTLPNLVGSLR